MSMPAGPPPQLRSVVTAHALGSLLLVGVVAAAFTLVGVVTDPQDGDSTTEDPLAEGPDADAPDPGRAPEPSAPPADDPPTAPPATDADPGEDDASDGEPDPAEPTEPAEDPDPPGEPPPDPEPEPAPDPDPPADRLDPAAIGIQVLDGYQVDGGAAAASVAASLGDLGYRIVARNPALRYEATTVLWTPGYEAEARQVAADLGGAAVREQPGNLSASVAVHVVVGADRG